MKSQRERIRDLLDPLLKLSPDGTFGPEPGGMTPEIANQLHALGSEIRAYGARERIAQARKEGKELPRSELIDADAEDSGHAFLDALHQARHCKPEDVARWRDVADSALEHGGTAISDPAFRADAELPRDWRPRTKDHLEARRADAQERRALVEARDKALGQVAGAEDLARKAQAQLEDVQVRVVPKLIGQRDAFATDLTSARAELELAMTRATSAQAHRDRFKAELATVELQRDAAVAAGKAMRAEVLAAQRQRDRAMSDADSATNERDQALRAAEAVIQAAKKAGGKA